MFTLEALREQHVRPATQGHLRSVIMGVWMLSRFEPSYGAAELGAAVHEALGWAEGHPSKVREIVRQFSQFATRYLNRDGVDCYFLRVLRGVAALGEGPIQLPADVRSPHWNAHDGT